MTKIAALTPQLSGHAHIDALLNDSPHWNHFQPAVANTMFYSFALPAGGGSDSSSVTGVSVFSASQVSNARLAIMEVARFTGIRFVETQDPAQAQIVLLNANITLNAQTTGLASWTYGWDDLPDGEFSAYTASGTLYLDNVEFRSQNSSLSAGSQGYQTLLHELGHLMGLKHPHETSPENPAQLPDGQDDTAYTVMSYNSTTRPGYTFSPYDIAALRWLYGGDGLGGARGATEGGGRYLMGTPSSDTGLNALVGSAYSDLFEGGAGNDEINGGDGIDFVRVDVARDRMTLARTAAGFTLDDGGSVDQLVNVERILYSNGAIALDIDGAGGQAYRLYSAVLGRAPDSAGLGFWLSNMDQGVSLSAVADDMMSSPEFIEHFGASLSNQQLVEASYQNFLGRVPEQAGMEYWLDALEAGTITQAEALAFISESGEHRTIVDPAIANGFMYTPWV